MTTYAEIAEEAARVIVEHYELPRDSPKESSIATLAWASGDHINYETALAAIVEEAIRYDRAVRAVKRAKDEGLIEP